MFEQDTPASLYNEFIVLENEIEKIGRNLKALAITEAQVVAEYEYLKNQELVSMFIEEAEHKFKRTEAQRQAIYRTKYQHQRLAQNLARADVKSDRDLLSALQSKLTGLQSRKGIMMSEIEMNARRP